MHLDLSEQQWLSWQEDPQALLEFAGRTSPRKIRLFYCACVRRLWSLLKDRRSRAAVEASELFGDGCIPAAQLLEARKAGYGAWYEVASGSLDSAEENLAAAAFMCANEELAYASGIPWRVAAATGKESEEYKTQALLFRDVVANPFRSAGETNSLSIALQSSPVVQIAQQIYENWAFDQIPALADALAAAGCHNPEILAHCRDEGPHVRGCWVVDLVRSVD